MYWSMAIGMTWLRSRWVATSQIWPMAIFWLKGFCHNITNFVHYLPDIMRFLCASSMRFERAVDHKKLDMVKGGISPKWQLQRVIRSSAWKRQKSGFRVKTWGSSNLVSDRELIFGLQSDESVRPHRKSQTNRVQALILVSHVYKVGRETK